MARKIATVQPAETLPAVRVYKVHYHYCPIIFVEARDEQDAAQKYRDRFDLHPCRTPIVEVSAHGGG